MRTVTLKGLWAHKRRLLGTFLAVLLGVSFLFGTLLLGDTMRASFQNLFASANAGSDAVVRAESKIVSPGDATPGFVEESLASEIASVPGVAAVAPAVDAYGALLGKDGDQIGGNGPPQQAGSWIDDKDLNPYRIAEGRAPDADDEVVIDRATAKAGDLAVGDTTTLLTPSAVTVHVVGIATFGSEDGLGRATFTAFTLEGAQRHLTGRDDMVSTIRVRGDDGVSQADLVQRLSSALPDGVEAVTGEELTREDVGAIQSGFLDIFTTILTVFAGIALVVATFSINNTFSVVAAQRSRESALLRALGASRGQVVGSTLAEALIVGVLASGAGLIGGVVFTEGLKAVLRLFGLGIPADGLTFTASSVLLSLVVGIAVTMVAALAPALRASRVAPLAALRDVAVDSSATSRWRVFSTVTQALVRVLGAPLRWRGVSGRLARRNASRNPRRTAATATALVVGVGVVTLATVATASLKASVADAVAGSVRADLIVVPSGFGGGMDPAVADRVATVPSVDSAVALRSGEVVADGRQVTVTIADPAAIPSVLDLGVSAGSLASLASLASLDGMSGPGVAVSTDVASDRGWQVGSVVPVTFADGASTELPVAAVFEGSDIVGDYLLGPSVWAPHATQDLATTVLVDVAPSADLSAVQAAVTSASETANGPPAQTRDEYVDSVASAVDTLLALVYVMLALAVIIAVMGIANTLSLAVYERTRELGLLRAVGATRTQIGSMVRWESVVVAVLGTVLGLGLGVLLGWVLVLLASSYGLTSFALPTVSLLVVLLGGALAGVVAGLRPARRAARLDILQAVAAD